MTKVTLAPGQALDWADWQSAFTRAAVSMPGFLSLETIPLPGQGEEWHIIQRFKTAEALAAWRASPAREEAILRLGALRAHAAAPLAEEAAPDFHAVTAVTEVITTRVAPGREDAFQDWSARMQAAQSAFPGYLGTLVQAPVSDALPFWTTLVRFASGAELEAWLTSPERAAELALADPAVAAWASHRLSGPFAGWFPTQPGGAVPPAWKQSSLVLLVLFPVVMLELRFLSPLLEGLPPAIATFIGNAVSILLLSWLLVRLVSRLFGWWLMPPKGPAGRRVERLGVLALAGLYLLEILVFTFLI